MTIIHRYMDIGLPWIFIFYLLLLPAAGIHSLLRLTEPQNLARSPEGADASALFYSFVETAKANHLNPYDYLTFLFEKYNDYKKNDRLIEILPNRISRRMLDLF